MGIYFMKYRAIAKIRACRNTAETDVSHDMNTRLLAGGRVIRRPGDKRIKRITSRNIIVLG